jgi:hypothetical protein
MGCKLCKDAIREMAEQAEKNGFQRSGGYLSVA